MSDNDRSWNAINSFLIFATGFTIGFLIRPYLFKCPIENTSQCSVTVTPTTPPKPETFRILSKSLNKRENMNIVGNSNKFVKQQIQPYNQ